MKTTLFALLIAVGSLLSGCSTIEAMYNANKGAADILTNRVVFTLAYGAEDPLAAKREIIREAESIKGKIDTGVVVTIGDFTSYVRSRIPMEGLNPIDRLTVEDILAEYDAALERELKSGEVRLDTPVYLKSVIDQIITAANRVK